jgi:hypothetical protein
MKNTSMTSIVCTLTVNKFVTKKDKHSAGHQTKFGGSSSHSSSLRLRLINRRKIVESSVLIGLTYL